MFIKKAYPRHTLNINLSTFQLACNMLFNNTSLEGKHIPRFEKSFADYIGISHAVGVESARKGLFLILEGFKFQEGDEVIMPAYTFKMLPMTVIACGLKPVFVDVEVGTNNLNPVLIENNITARTKAIVVTHMFGQPADMTSILEIARKYKLKIVEDCAHACGAKYKNQRTGSLGDAAIFSFKMGKNLPCFGGGMITTSDPQLYMDIKSKVEKFPYPKRWDLLKEIISVFIFYCGTSSKIFFFITYPFLRILDIIGSDFSDSHIEESLDMNCDIKIFKNQTRLANLQAAIGLQQLVKLDEVNAKRKMNAEALIKELQKIENISIPFQNSHSEPTYLYFRIQVPEVKLFRKELLAYGIDSKRDDMSACSKLNVFSIYKSSCPVAEKIPGESIEIPNNPVLCGGDIQYISECIKSVAKLI